MVGGVVSFFGGLIQTASGTLGGRGAMPLKPSRMRSEGDVERDSALLGERGGALVVHGVGRHEADAGMTMLGVVPAKEVLAMRTGVLDRPEARWKVGPVLQRFELRLGVRIVIRDVRTAVRLGDVQIDEQRGHWLGAHARAAISM